MKRNVATLADKEYDLVIVGGGIYGASVARDAALRGLDVALVDKGDFGSATSGNSHKIIHGGLRYLQHGDLKRMRESVRERSILMRIAPHLVYPMPFLLPTYRHLLQSKLIMSMVLKLNDLISCDRNRGLDPQKKIPRSRVISRDECLRLCPGLDQSDLTGGSLFFDGQVVNTDRLTLSILLSSVQAGAHLANYVQVIRFLRNGNHVTGVWVKDRLSGDHLDVRAKIVVNCTGPWIGDVLQLLQTRAQPKRMNLLKAVVLVARPVAQNIAIGIPSKSPKKADDAIVHKNYRYIFITPWRNRSLIGTFESPYSGQPDDFRVSEQDIDDFIREINAAYPAAGMKRQDVRFVYGGLVPRSERDLERNGVQLLKHYQLRDHEVEDRIRGLISVIGVKYTTARGVAEKTVDVVLSRLGKRPVTCQTAVTPVYGGAVGCLEEFLCREVKGKAAGLSEETLRHLIQSYGSEYREIVRYCKQDPEWGKPVTPDSPVIRAEVLHAARKEMAVKLSDVIFRRTGLGTAGYPGSICLESCAAIMAAELGWSHQRTRNELEETKLAYGNLGCL